MSTIHDFYSLKGELTALLDCPGTPRKNRVHMPLLVILLSILLAACAPSIDSEMESAVTAAQQAQEGSAISEEQIVEGVTATSEPLATATMKPASQKPMPAKPRMFGQDSYGVVIFTKENSAEQQELADLTMHRLESVLTATGAMKDVTLGIEQIPEETGGDWAAASIGAKIGFWVEADEDDGLLTVKSNAYFPDNELLLGEGSLGLNRTADAMLEPFTTESMLEAGAVLADRLAVIINAYVGYSAAQEGNYTECARRFTSALDHTEEIDVTYNRSDASHNALGGCLAGLGRAEEAKTQYEAAIAVNPDISSAHYGLGNYYFEQRDYAKAEEFYQLAVEKTLVDPLATEETEARIYASLGNVSLVSGEYEKAVAYFDKSIAITPEYPAYYLTRALAKGALGQDDYASDLQQCITLVDHEREPSAYFLEVAADCQAYLDGGFNFTEVGGDAAEESEDYRVDSAFSSISVRSGPSVDGYAVIGYLYADEEVVVIARTSNGVWYLVELDDARRGWVNATLLQRTSGDSSEVPVAATIPPTPIPTQTLTPMPTATSMPTFAATPSPDSPKREKTPKPNVSVPTLDAVWVGSRALETPTP